MPKAFLSYSRSSEGAVQRICNDLMSCGIDEVWWDKRLVGAQDWWDTILQQVRMADVVVCLVDDGIRESLAVRREYQYAIDLGKPLLPVLLSDHVNISTLPIELAGKHYVDYRPDNPDPKSSLVQAVRELPPAPELPNPLPPAPEIPISERDYLIEKVSSTEPLSEDIQIGVLSRLRRLERSDDQEQREFAQTSLRRLRSRKELLASVADDMDSVAVSQNGSKIGFKAGLAASVVALICVVSFILYQRSLDTDTFGAEGVDSIASVGSISVQDESRVSDEDAERSEGAKLTATEHVADVEKSAAVADTQNKTLAQPLLSVEQESLAGKKLSAEENIRRDDDAPSADMKSDAELLQAKVEKPADNSANSAQRIVVSSNEKTGETATSPQGDETVSSTIDSPKKIDSVRKAIPVTDTINTIEEGTAEIDWQQDFTVFEEARFDLCGYNGFTATAKQSVDGVGVIRLSSTDRSIPDQPFRGLSEQVVTDQIFELLPECLILLNHEKTSGIARIRVRVKGDY